MLLEGVGAAEWCVIRVIALAPPITDVSLCFMGNTSRRLSSKFWHPPEPPPHCLKGPDDE